MTAEREAMPRRKAFKYHPSYPGDHLTPVHFELHVLVKYAYDSRYYCDFHSDTYGTVGDSDGKFNISFGINSGGVVIAWLGDLDRLPSGERQHWMHNNIPLRGDNKSDFFTAQLPTTPEEAFTAPPLPIRCLNALAKWNAAFSRRYSVHLYKPCSIEDRIQDTRRYKRLIFNNSDDFKCFVSEFNEIVNENTNNQKLRSFLKSQRVPIEPGAKGNKLLEKVYNEVLKDSDNLIASFFFLYDLRLW
jgi:hypothetical protein